MISNCTLVGNSALQFGGGTYSGTLVQCTVARNSAYCGGGAYSSTLENCRLIGNVAASSYVVTSFGGGAYGGTLNHCVLSGNGAGDAGGGACYAVMNNCLVTSNSAYYGGGSGSGILNNCTLVGNFAVYQGGTSGDIRNNSIVYYNRASDPTMANYASYDGGTFTHCCTTPLPNSFGNFTNDPQLSLAPNDFHLQANSPCINAGKNAFVNASTDLDGHSRVAAGTVDVGAYEVQAPRSILSYVWAQQFGLATDGSADYADADADGMNNWQEWIAGTDPTNPASIFQLFTPTFSPPARLLSWNSDTNHHYFVQRATAFARPLAFTTISTNLAGQPGTTAFRDASAPAGKALFYRVGTYSTNPPANLLLQAPAFATASASLAWTSVTNRYYCIARSTNLGRAGSFILLQTNIPGLPGTTGYVDSNAPASGTAFYRVGIQP
jgi:hypothetical protein